MFDSCSTLVGQVQRPYQKRCRLLERSYIVSSPFFVGVVIIRVASKYTFCVACKRTHAAPPKYQTSPTHDEYHALHYCVSFTGLLSNLCHNQSPPFMTSMNTRRSARRKGHSHSVSCDNLKNWLTALQPKLCFCVRALVLFQCTSQHSFKPSCMYLYRTDTFPERATS